MDALTAATMNGVCFADAHIGRYSRIASCPVRLEGTDAGYPVVVPAIKARDCNFTRLSDAVVAHAVGFRHDVPDSIGARRASV